MDEKLVIIGQYENAEMAHIDRIALEEVGIHAVLENENLSAVSLYHVIPHCEVHLLVRQNDAEQARRVLEEIQDSGPIEEETDAPAFDEDEN
jgi:hypothetical protein